MAQISDRRAEIMDSLVSNVPKDIRKDFDKLHAHLHNFGQNDEERVWMYYGYIAANFKYDYKLATSKRKQKYSPQYTCKKRSGVCIDFSELFEAFCRKSGITCFTVSGKAKMNFLYRITMWCHLKFRNGHHAWNVVKYNDDWHLMDVTWSGVDSTSKYYKLNKKGEKETSGKLRHFSREYYDCAPDNFMQKHKPYMPAFYLTEKIPSRGTAFRLPSKRKYVHESYDYKTALDSLEKLDTIPGVQHIFSVGPQQFNWFFSDEVEAYTKREYRYRTLYWEKHYFNQKVTRGYKHTKEDLLAHLTRIHYLMEHLDIDERKSDCKYIENLLIAIAKMEKKEEKARKAAENGT